MSHLAEPPAYLSDYADATDSLMDMLEFRIAALEEVIAARGFRRFWAAWTLGRQLRQSVQNFEGDTFIERRLEAISSEWGSRDEDQREFRLVGGTATEREST